MSTSRLDFSVESEGVLHPGYVSPVVFARCLRRLCLLFPQLSDTGLMRKACTDVSASDFVEINAAFIGVGAYESAFPPFGVLDSV